MERDILKNLGDWKSQKRRKPLILKGARQVGKTYILEQFGKQSFQSLGGEYHLLDFKQNKRLTEAFSTNNPVEILRYIEIATGHRINPKQDLLILDEVQECEGAIPSLKYFHQQMPDLCVVAAGSHLGLLKNEESFPVGYVNFLSMHPMTYKEVLRELDPLIYEELMNLEVDTSTRAIHSIIHERLLELLRVYFFSGGLPEVVQTLSDTFKEDFLSGIASIREIQNELLEGYKVDFVKYCGLNNAAHILHVFEAIPGQLAEVQDEEVKKFRFNQVIPKRKGFESIAGPLSWLEKSRLCIKNHIASKGSIPLKGFCRSNRFKLFFFDIGLLHAALRVDPAAILQAKLGSYKGFIAENFVAQELFAHYDAELYAWQEGRAEIEFLLAKGAELIPLEVKSSARSRRAKSLESYINRYHPSQAYKVSWQNRGWGPNQKYQTLPIYLISSLLQQL